MKQSNKGFDYSYNAQAVVDGEDQIIVAAEVTREANDKQQAVPMARAALDNLRRRGSSGRRGPTGRRVPIPNTADTGYFSEKAVGELEQLGMDPHVAIGRQKHHEGPPRRRRPCGGEREGEDASQAWFDRRQGRGLYPKCRRQEIAHEGAASALRIQCFELNRGHRPGYGDSIEAESFGGVACLGKPRGPARASCVRMM